MTCPGLEAAPFFEDVAEGPAGGRAWWLTCDDGVRIRLGLWPLEGARGTVLMFPGRTEYIEKYGRLACDFHAQGYAMIAVDWRGQGLADRLIEPRDMGHVGDFDDYQKDVQVVVDALERMADAPKPWHLLAHSMGGGIGLQAIHDGLDVSGVAFSAPMWGISLTPANRLLAEGLKLVARPTGLWKQFTPSTGPAVPGDFETNRLTSDKDQFEYMERQVAAHPDLALGGPSLHWLIQALEATDALVAMNAPERTALTVLGGREKIVSADAIRARIANWPGSRLELIEGAEHEVLMERAEFRDRALSMICETFDAAS